MGCDNRKLGVLQPPRMAIRPRPQAVGFVVAGELFLDRIPLDGPAQANADVGHVTGRDPVMGNVGRRNRLLASLDAGRPVGRSVSLRLISPGLRLPASPDPGRPVKTPDFILVRWEANL